MLWTGEEVERVSRGEREASSQKSVALVILLPPTHPPAPTNPEKKVGVQQRHTRGAVSGSVREGRASYSFNWGGKCITLTKNFEEMPRPGSAEQTTFRVVTQFVQPSAK